MDTAEGRNRDQGSFDRDIAAVEASQDGLARIQREMGRRKDFLDEEGLRSKAWIEGFERSTAGDPRSAARAAELWDAHASIAAATEEGFDEAFAACSRDALRLDAQRDGLVEQRRTAKEGGDGKGVVTHGHRD